MTTGTTLITSETERRHELLLRYRLEAVATRIAADSQRVLSWLPGRKRDAWRDAWREAWWAAQEAIGIAQARGESSATSIAAAVANARRTIQGSMDRLLRLVPVEPFEELVLADARAIRELAGQLGAIVPTPPTPGSLERPSTVASSVARPRILIAEDERTLRELLRRRLTALGYDVTEADSGRAAEAATRNQSFDLVITDIQMPEMTGLELLRALKSSDRTRDIPVLVVSSQDDLDSVVSCIEGGAEDHIPKPYQPALLLARVKASIERKRMHDAQMEYIRRIHCITDAARAVEEDNYRTALLETALGRDDALAALARVFDRMVTGLKSREERLHFRVQQLRSEVGASSGSLSRAAMRSAESPFESGQILAARYEILDTLGQGGMGMVYRARDMELGEEIAIKVVRRDLVKADPTMVDRLKSEIRLARRISHRNVVRAHDMGEWQGTYFITMEFVRGISVADLLDRRGRLSVESTVAIGVQLSEALAVAHDAQVIHRDIKPANLLVDDEGMLKVMDFGIARSVERDAVSLTAGGFIIGTPQYMAPEQMMNGMADERSDLYAVGAVLYECLAGRPPYVAETPLALVALIVDGGYPPLHEIAPTVPAALAELVQRQLRLDASARMGSARALAVALAEAEHVGMTRSVTMAPNP